MSNLSVIEDNDIINLKTNLQVEEICSTCGQLIRETHEKTKETTSYQG